MKIRFNDHAFSFQLLRVLGSAASRQADVGEALATAERIREGDFESWAAEWSRTATRIETAAETCAKAEHRTSAGETYLRAANYHRAAEFFLHGNPADPRIREFSVRSARCFREGLRLCGISHQLVDVPYEGTTLPGIFYPAGEGKRPTLIAQTGFDGTIDGLMPWALAAVRRGWHCLTFEGPGQGLVIRNQNLPFRPDWESVVTPIVDHLVSRPDVDPDRVVLLGVSFGGYLAPRAAAFEKRLAACVANGGVLDFSGPRVPAGMTREQYVAAIREHPDRVNATMRSRAEKDTAARWGQENGMYTFHAASPAEWLNKLLDYDLTQVAKQITCPMLVVDVEGEDSFPGEAKKLYDALTCPKTWLFFTEEEGAGDHCQTGSPALAQQRSFDWIEETVR
jgi:alpha-beta hydrolase superfamily lysophospholipase